MLNADDIQFRVMQRPFVPVRIVTSSGPAARELREEWGMPEKKIHSLMDGVDTDDFVPSSREEARRAMNLPPDRRVAVFLGVLNSYQGIDLLLTDVVMPGMNGKELFEALRLSRPNLKVLFTSGYTDDVIAPRGVLDRTVAYIPKPFRREALAAKIREVLSGKRSSCQSGSE